MKKLVKVGLVVPVVLLVAVAVFGPGAMAADEAEGQAALNRDLNQALNDKDRAGDRVDATSVDPSKDTPSDADDSGVVTTDGAGDTSGRNGGERALGSDRSGGGGAAERVARRGQQAPRGTTVAAYDDEKSKGKNDNNSGKSGGGSDENNDENDDDEDVTPSHPEPTE
jgi:hypothetical protein